MTTGGIIFRVICTLYREQEFFCICNCILISNGSKTTVTYCNLVCGNRATVPQTFRVDFFVFFVCSLFSSIQLREVPKLARM